MTERVVARLEDEYSDSNFATALRLLERIGADLSGWREVSEGDRIERAALTFARGDLARLRDAVELARRDWRDLLVAVDDA
jgi:hypothetical protein